MPSATAPCASFFFQAEDGIRDATVNWSSDVCSSDLIAAGIPSCGVNDCEAFALLLDHLCEVGGDLDVVIRVSDYNEPIHFIAGIWSGVSRGFRSEERRVGKVCRVSGWRAVVDERVGN